MRVAQVTKREKTELVVSCCRMRVTKRERSELVVSCCRLRVTNAL